MKKIILALFASLAMTLPALLQAQINIPKNRIPSNIPSEVRQEIERLYSENHEARAHGAHMLGKMGAKALPSIPFLIAVLAEPEDACEGGNCNHDHHGHPHSPSEEALRTLVSFGEPAVEPLIGVCAAQDLETRRKVVMALGEIKDARAIPCLSAALKAENSTVRMMAAWGLAHMGEPAVNSLLAELADKTSPGRSDAAYALGKLKQPSAIEPLIATLKEKDDGLRKESAKALSRLTGQDFGESAAEWQKWWTENQGGKK